MKIKRLKLPTRPNKPIEPQEFLPAKQKSIGLHYWDKSLQQIIMQLNNENVDLSKVEFDSRHNDHCYECDGGLEGVYMVWELPPEKNKDYETQLEQYKLKMVEYKIKLKTYKDELTEYKQQEKEKLILLHETALKKLTKLT
jgi:hypothetical protein